MFAALNRTADASAVTVTTAEAKAFLRVTADDDDALILSLEKAARIACEEYTSRAFVTQTWVAEFDHLQAGNTLLLPRPKLISVSSVKYKNSLGVLTAVQSEDYESDNSAEPGAIRFITIPPFASEYRNPLRVEYTAGFGGADNVPEDIKAAIKFTISEWYSNRVAGEIPEGVKSLLTQYRIHNLVR